MNQAVVRTAADRVLRGDWLHLFPEGKVRATRRTSARRWCITLLWMDCATCSLHDELGLAASVLRRAWWAASKACPLYSKFVRC